MYAGEMRGYASALGALSLLAALASASAARAEPAWGTDKAAHLGISLGLSGGAYAGLRLLSRDPPALRLTFSIALAFIPGLLKEVYDSGRPANHFSGLDLTWDAIGVVTGAFIAFGIDLLVTRLRKPRPTISSTVIFSAGSGP